MQREHPAPCQHIHISLARFIQLRSVACMHERADVQVWELVEEAIDQWLRRHAPQEIPLPEHLGYQWKQLFLPNGTVLRTVFNGKNYHCRVDNDQILYEGKPVSPSGFVNAVGGMRRNAWKSLWVLRPESALWQRADSLRARKRLSRPRKPAAPLPPNGHAGMPLADGAARSSPASAHLQAPAGASAPQPGRIAAPVVEAEPDALAAECRHTRPPILSGWERKSPPRSGPARKRRGLAASLRNELLPFMRQLLRILATEPNSSPRERTG